MTRQTADTFRASATFLELLSIWDKLEPEAESKIKFAKYHALRIAKALKAGEDPNLTNPKPEIAPEEAVAPLDPNDPEVQSITNAAAMQPTVEDEVMPQISPPPAPNGLPSITPAGDPAPHVSPLEPPAPLAPSHLEVSPIEPSPADERANSEGGGYFPEVPTFTAQSSAPSLPTAPPDDIEMKSPGGSLDPSSFYTAQAPPGLSPAPTSILPPAAPTSLSSAVSPSMLPPPAPQPVVLSPAVQVSVTNSAGQVSVTNSAAQVQGPYRTDDESTTLAQKHARWAISALNFEDVNTAVKELRTALRALGAA